MTLQAFLNEAARRIEAEGLECGDPNDHALRLASEVLAKPMSRLLLDGSQTLPDSECEALQTALVRRLEREPLQYIVERAAFWKSNFVVGPGVLIPRPETERLVEKVLELLPDRELRIAELGAGSGNIGITSLLERPKWRWKAFEVSPRAAAFARKNAAALLPASAAYEVCVGDFFENIQAGDGWNAIVSNPPYIASSLLETLSEEVQSEPRRALDGGDSGRVWIERLIDVGRTALANGGRIFLEIGDEQGPSVQTYLKAQGFQQVQIVSDYAGRDRIAIGEKI